MRLAFFLEDLAHEKFIVTLTLRVLGLSDANTELDIRNARRGDAIGSYYRFLQDYRRGREKTYELLVVASDGNCTGPGKRRRVLEERQKRTGYEGTVIYAIPDPHIERWYLLDTLALAQAAEIPVPDDAPAHKCEKRFYKNLLLQAFANGGIRPLSGGSEYGDTIADALDWDGIRLKPSRDESFCQFVDELREFGRRNR